MMRSPLLSVLAAVAIVVPIEVWAQNQPGTAGTPAQPPVTDCDRLAANAHDQQRVGNGIDWDALDAIPAIAACKKALVDHPQVARFHYQLGRALLKDQQYEGARVSAEQAANMGHTFALIMLGSLYENGQGVAKDLARAASYVKQAASLGDVDAQMMYADVLIEGKGVPANQSEGFQWLERAAQGGHVIAQGSLGYRYNQGIGVAKDYVKAIEWTRKAADSGDAVAQFNLATCYERAEGVDQDFFQAYAWAKKSADQGFAPALDAVGRLMYEGYGIPENKPEGLAWMIKAADRGYAGSLFIIAKIHLNGRSVPKDAQAGMKWMHKAAESGNAQAQLYLGNAYLEGRDVEPDEKIARQWLEKASSQGNREAAKKLGALDSRKTLDEAYGNYLKVKMCAESKLPWIAISAYDHMEAKAAMRKLEDVSPLSRSEKDKLWEANITKHADFGLGLAAWDAWGSGGYKDSAWTRMICGEALTALRRAAETDSGGRRQRDF
jgi:TPR repeat protein